MATEGDNDLPPLLSKPKTGTEFLASSHFKLGLEPQWMARRDPLAYCSTFKKDYPPHPFLLSENVSLPKPAQIMHKNGDTMDQYCSITKDHFIPKEVSKRDFVNSTYALTKTNFKMDVDKQIESFRTTHTDCFPPYKTELGRNKSQTTNWMASHIPQGDKFKVQWPESDYQGNFVRHGGQRREKTSNPLFATSNAIQGDSRVDGGHLFNTTNQSAYPYKYTGKKNVDYNTRYPPTNIPNGDKEKLEEILSTQQASFPLLSIDDYNKSDRSKALSKLQSTSFKMGDDRNKSFCSTAQNSYQAPVGGGREICNKLNIGKSAFPDGDRDSFRSFQRVNTTVNHSDFVPPPPGYGNPKVDGSKIRTVSHVDLGRDDRQKSYETTMTESFQNNHLNYRRVPGDSSKSSIPLDYFGDLVHEPSYKIDFLPNGGFSTMRPNPAALEQLKKSHIRLPESFDRQFQTTHRFTYTPKKTSRDRVLDSGKIQRSSVPLGTLSA